MNNKPSKEEIIRGRLVRKIERRDRIIEGLNKKVQRLESELAVRTLDLESLSHNLRREVQHALCNVRMIPVFGGKKDSVIAEVITTNKLEKQ